MVNSVKNMEELKKLLNWGIVVIDKPSGPTSYTISDLVKEHLNTNKTSHFGTLDPQVSGVLPIALGRACRLAGFFLGHDKIYVGILRTHKEISIKVLQKIIDEKFIGNIKQLPPKKSNVKRAIREREIKMFKISEKKEKDFVFTAEVQGGTYIRKLCSDLGDLIGGAHMLELRRIKAGIFSEQEVVNLYDFEKAVEENKKGKPDSLRKMILPMEEAIKRAFETVELKDSCLKKILTGKPLEKENLVELPKEKIFAVFSKGNFVEMAEKTEEGKIFARPKFVLN